MIKVKSVRLDSGSSFMKVNEELLNLQWDRKCSVINVSSVNTTRDGTHIMIVYDDNTYKSKPGDVCESDEEFSARMKREAKISGEDFLGACISAEAGMSKLPPPFGYKIVPDELFIIRNSADAPANKIIRVSLKNKCLDSNELHQALLDAFNNNDCKPGTVWYTINEVLRCENDDSVVPGVIVTCITELDRTATLNTIIMAVNSFNKQYHYEKNSRED